MFLALILTALLASTVHASIEGYFRPNDRQKLLSVLSFTTDSDNLSHIYYAVKSYKLLGENIPTKNIKPACDQLLKHYGETLTLEEHYQAISAWTLLSCSGKLHTDTSLRVFKEAIENVKLPVSDIRFALESIKLLDQSVTNAQKVSKIVQDKLKEDDSVQNLGHALHVGAILGATAGKFALDRVEEVVAQADEVDGKYLQWDGGLSVTSLLLTGLLRLPVPKPLTPQQADKFGSYLLTRRTVQSPKGVLALLEATIHLTLIEESPVAITIPGSAQVTVENPNLKVHISDILGKVLRKAPGAVVAQSATRITDDVVVLSKQALRHEKGVEYVLPLKVEPGLYRIALTVGSHGSTLTVRVLGPISFNSLEIGLSDSDGASEPKLNKLAYDKQLHEVLRADSSQHLVVRFSLSRPAHQTFVRLFDKTSKKEIIFVAELDSSKLYKLDVKLASDLGQSGNYKIDLIIGDSVITNPIFWELGTVELKLPLVETVKRSTRGPKPEIEHLFRLAEKRPAEFVSLLFTALTLTPLLLLLGLWKKIGVNCGNFIVLAVPFHLGLGGILGLFSLFWLKLDMFSTCAWLIPIGGFTFLAGHKLLSHIANQKK